MYKCLIIFVVPVFLIGCVSVKEPYEITIGEKENYRLEFKDGTRQYAKYFDNISDDSVYVYLTKEILYNERGRIHGRKRVNAIYAYSWDSLDQVMIDQTGKTTGVFLISTVVVLSVVTIVAMSNFSIY